MIDDAPVLGLGRRHEVVAVQGALDVFVRAATMLRIQLVQPPLRAQDVLGVTLNVRSDPLKSA